jgi:hypothetical protein
MAFQQKENSGSLFANDKREKDTHPTHTGSCNIGGAEFYISAWVRESSNGRKFFSMAFKPKGEKREPAPYPTGGTAEFDDKIPF